MNAQPAPVFLQGRPFFEMVMSFLAATVGMGPVFDPSNPLRLSPASLAAYPGIVRSHLTISMDQVHRQCTTGGLSANAAVDHLCCMLLNSAYETAKPHTDKSPEFELFRHLRNAASHRNRFNFRNHEPALPALWSGFAIDHNLKGTSNPLFGAACVGHVVSAGDVLALLHDIERKLP